MATLSIQLSVADTTKNITVPSGSIVVTSGDGEHEGSITTTTSEGSVTIDSQITAGNGPGVLMLRNLSTTAAETIEIGFATTVYPIKLNAQDGAEMYWVLLPLNSSETDFFHKAASGTPQLWFKIFERGA